jgi:hypothetical protein
MPNGTLGFDLAQLGVDDVQVLGACAKSKEWRMALHFYALSLA